MTYCFESALAKQLGSGADQRIPPTFSFGVTAAVTPTHAASEIGTTLPFSLNGHGMMARMPDLSRRAVLGLGASATLGAGGVFALDMLLQPRTSHATPAPAIGTNVPLAPTRPLDPPPPAQAAPTMTTGSFVSAARGNIDQLGHRPSARPDQAAAAGDRAARQGQRRGHRDGRRRRTGPGTSRQRRATAVCCGRRRRGGSYWHKRASGEDSGAMVLSELIPLLDTHNLDTSRVAFLGWSMGGYGALLLGGRLGPARPRRYAR